VPKGFGLVIRQLGRLFGLPCSLLLQQVFGFDTVY